MSKGLEVNVEVGLCTKDMAKENPIKDFEILIEEYKDKWSKQMYDYFKECLNEIKKKLKAFDSLSKDDEKAKKLLSLEIEKNRALEIIKAMNFIRVYETIGGDFVLEAVDDGIKMTKDNYDVLKKEFGYDKRRI